VKPQPEFLPRLIMAAFVAFGIAMPWAIVTAILVDSIPSAFFGTHDEETLRMLPDAVVIKWRRDWKNSRAADAYRFSDGRPVPAEVLKRGGWLGVEWLCEPMRREEADLVPFPWQERLIPLWTDKDARDEHWYFLHDGRPDGRAYFVGYQPDTKECVGYLSRSGLSLTPPAPEDQFAIEGRRPPWHGVMVSRRYAGVFNFPNAKLPESTILLLSGDALWRIDLQRRTAAQIGEFQSAFSIGLAPSPPGAAADESPREKMLVRTKTEVIETDLGAKPLRRWPIPVEAQAELIEWYDAGEGKAVLAFGRRIVDRTLERQFLWLNAEGQVVRRETVRQLSGGWEPHEIWRYTPAVPMPAVLPIIFYAAASEVRGPDYAGPLSKIMAMFWPELLIVCLLATVLAALAYRRQVRFALPGAGAWAMFVFLFGPPGWLAYRWHRHWPVLEACGECHRPAPRDRESCASCGRVFAPPPLTGTEIFA